MNPATIAVLLFFSDSNTVLPISSGSSLKDAVNIVLQHVEKRGRQWIKIILHCLKDSVLGGGGRNVDEHFKNSLLGKRGLSGPRPTATPWPPYVIRSTTLLNASHNTHSVAQAELI